MERTLAALSLLAIILSVVRSECPGTSRHEGLLYPHMEGNGDTEFLPRLDDAKIALNITGTYKFYGVKYQDQVWVVTNGMLAMNESDIHTRYNPAHFKYTGTPVIAPLHSDVEINLDDPEASHIWFRETSDRKLLKRFKDDMGDNFCNAGKTFKPKSLIIVTYQRVQSFCDHHDMSNYYYYYYYNYWYYWYYYGRKRSAEGGRPLTKEDVSDHNIMSPEERATAPINYFQLVYATNNRAKSFVMFNYHSICWNRCWSYNRAGFNDGLGKTYEVINSGTNDFDENAELSNVDKPGRFMYRVGGKSLRAPDCSKLE